MLAAEGPLCPVPEGARQGCKARNVGGTSRTVSQRRFFEATPQARRAFEQFPVDHGRTSPAGLSSFIVLDPHAGSGGGLGLSRSIRRRMSANSARGTATSASWNTT